MKNFTALAVAAAMVLFCTAEVFAEEIQGGTQEILWNGTEEVYAELYSKTQPAAAQAIVNTDSFVDKTADQTDFDLPCKAALLMDEATGQILYAKNAHMQLPIASITKVMTMLLVFEAIEAGKISYTDTVPISNHAFSMGGSQIWLEPGEIFSVDELLKAVAVSSANDAAVALSEFVGGSEEVFCSMMNSRAAQLGMENTNFVNACGLDAQGHLSTAYDVALMSRELMKHREVFSYTTIWMDYLRNGETQLVNTNKMLHSYSGTTGLKTGTTGRAGVCISATAQRQGMSLIAVVLGAATGQERFDAAKTLLDFGFSNFESRGFPSAQDYPTEISVKYGLDKTVQLEYTLPSQLLFLKGRAKQLQSRAVLPQYITAPMSEGTIVGTVELYSAGEKIKEYPILLAENAEKITFRAMVDILFKEAAQFQRTV